MSITGSSATVSLKSMDMGDLQKYLVQSLADHDIESELESMSDDELILLVSKKPVRKTMVRVERLRHRPLEVVVDVNYNKAGSSKNAIRSSKPTNSQDMFSLRWIWLLLIFGGAIIYLVNLLEGWISSLFGNSGDELTQVQLILTVVILSTLVAISWIYGVPYVIRQRETRMKQFDNEVLELISNSIKKLDESLIDTEIIRCWSCFSELKAQTKVCPKCGEEQK